MQTVIKQITDNLQVIAENTSKVYNAGVEEGKKLGGDYQTAYNNGYNEGHEEGYIEGKEDGKLEGQELGKQFLSDEFIKSLTNNGKRTNYGSAFRYWDLSILKYTNITVKPSAGNTYMFANTSLDGDDAFPYDNINLDLSAVTSLQYMFSNSNIEHLSTLDISNVTTCTYLFQKCSNLSTIDKLIISESGINNFGTSYATSSFNGCSNLVSLKIEGCIGKYFNIKDSTKLDGVSILSILQALTLENTAVNIILPSAAQKYITSGDADYRQDIYDEYARASNLNADNNFKYNITFE